MCVLYNDIPITHLPKTVISNIIVISFSFIGLYMNVQKVQIDKEFTEKMKNILLEEKKRLEKELAKFTTKNPHVNDDYEATYPEYGDKSDENAQEITQYLANKPLEMTLEKSLRDVNKALKRMGEGTYGICKYCDKPMEKKRIQARPTSSACVSCKKTLTQEI